MIYKTQQGNTQHVKIFRALAVEVKWLVLAEDWGFIPQISVQKVYYDESMIQT